MTLPPSDDLPGIPGAASWRAGQAGQAGQAASPRGHAGESSSPGSAPAFVGPVATPGGEDRGRPSELFELADWGSRAAAMVVDYLLRIAGAFALTTAGFVLLAEHPFAFDAEQFDAYSDAPGGGAGHFNLVWLLLSASALTYLSGLLYAPLFMAWWRGATPGKRLLRIRVVRESGANLTFGQSLFREPICKGLIVNLVGSSAMVVPAILSYLWPLWDGECRAGHDFLAHTRVVRTKRRA
ncbi:MAG: RDD family protein [Patulibacter sp.]